MTKKHINNAELNFILLSTDDIIVTSDPHSDVKDQLGGDTQFAPSRDFGGSDFNYRGVEKGFDDEEW